MKLKIGVIKGDGIGPEVVNEAMKVLDKVGVVYGHEFDYTQLLMGGASIDTYGVPLTDETIELAKNSDAVLLGSIGGDAKTSPWYKLEPSKRPEAGLLKIRKALNLFANLRPAVLYDELKGACPLKEEITEGGFDLMIMRELTGGLYFGERKTEEVDGGKPKIMIRVIDVRRMLMSLRLKTFMGTCFEVTDPLIEENNRCLMITGTEFSGLMLMDGKPENSEGTLTVAALTSLVFGVKTAEEICADGDAVMSDRMKEELDKIIPLSQIYLNETV